MGFAPEFSLGRPSRLGEVMKWIHCRGAFVKFHPPPYERNTAILWPSVYTEILNINLPPPSKNTWVNKTQYEKHRFRNRQAAENAAPKAGLKQSDIAELVGHSNNVVGRIERGEQTIDLKTILAYKKQFNVSADYIIDGVNNGNEDISDRLKFAEQYIDRLENILKNRT